MQCINDTLTILEVPFYDVNFNISSESHSFNQIVINVINNEKYSSNLQNVGWNVGIGQKMWK